MARAIRGTVDDVLITIVVVVGAAVAAAAGAVAGQREAEPAMIPVRVDRPRRRRR